MKKLLLFTILLTLFTACSFGSKEIKEEVVKDVSVKPPTETIEGTIDVETLYTIGKVWGILKYYHPAVASGDYNWDEQLFYIMDKIVESDRSLDDILVEWIVDLGEFETGPSDNHIWNTDFTWVTQSNFSEELEQILLKVKNSVRSSTHHYVNAGPAGEASFINELSHKSISNLDDRHRLLALFRYWNSIEYFFPYKNLMDENWDNILKEFIPIYLSSKSEDAYFLTTLQLIGKIQDTHAVLPGHTTNYNRLWGSKYAPVIITFVEEQAVVTGYYKEQQGVETGLEVGDVITSVNGQSVSDWIENHLKYASASNYPTQLRELAPNILRSNDNTLLIEYVREGQLEEKEITLYQRQQLGVDSHNIYNITKTPKFNKITDEIAYVYGAKLNSKDLKEWMEDIKDTKGLVIDLRSYPNDFYIYELSKYLLKEEVEFALGYVPNLEAPGSFYPISLTAGEQNEHYYKGTVAILINEVTQSAAEFFTMAFQQAPNSVVIGSTTAGADGNVTQIMLPGGIQTFFSGLGITYPDGTETQRVGIIPDIYVAPTIEGVKEGRDEVLERAVEYIENNQ